MLSSLFIFSLLVCRTFTSSIEKRLNNGVGVKPALGWNNYNAGLGPSAANALAAANAFVQLGLKDLGYTYINMDDTWSTKSRDSSGNLVADPSKFPNGMKALADQIHALGLKFGLYGDSGTETCSGYPGSQGYETKDAVQLAAWGIDYWKYDNCATPSGNSQGRYNTMRDALLATKRPILYSLCQWGRDNVWTWGATTGNSWRVGGDITNTWSSVASIAASNMGITSYAQPGGFNDYDMMEIGNGALTTAEERAHFGLWAICKSPIILGTNLQKISAASLKIIKNADIIAINQDSLGKAASTFTPSGSAKPSSGQLYPYWAGPISDGVVLGIVAANGAAQFTVNFKDVPGLGSGIFYWKELYSGTTGSGTEVTATLANHDMVIYKVTKASVVSTVSTVSTVTSSPYTVQPSTSTYTAVTIPSSSSSPSGPTAGQWAQCGGIGYSGPTVCANSYTCHELNPYYSQCY